MGMILIDAADTSPGNKANLNITAQTRGADILAIEFMGRVCYHSLHGFFNSVFFAGPTVYERNDLAQKPETGNLCASHQRNQPYY